MYPISEMQRYFATGATLSYDFRKKQLQNLKASIKTHEEAILSALKQDFGKPPFEAFATEVGFLYAEIDHALKHLRQWMKPKRVATALTSFPGKTWINAQPRGVTFIIAPWNYPFQLSIAPLVAAIAAGNCSLIKPSEAAPNTAAVIQKMIQSTFKSVYIDVVLGLGHEVIPPLLEAHRFDFIFYTGNPTVGKIIGKSAAEKLIPHVLELGGKSPALVEASANITVSAQRIVWGKFLNAGQTCVAPDFVLVHQSIQKELVEALKIALAKHYGKTPQTSADYPRIVNQKQFERLIAYLNQGNIWAGGEINAKERYIAPTILGDIHPQSALLREEIFGPILPILTYQTDEEALAILRNHPMPLAFYVFSKDLGKAKKWLAQFSSGGACINDTLVHLGNTALPFGGNGASGYGTYHGKFGFEAFSHLQGVQQTATWIDLPFRYPPYNSLKEKIIRMIFR